MTRNGEGVPPHDERAEQSVLGSMLLAQDAARDYVIDDVVATLEPSNFYNGNHRAIYQAIRSLHADGKPVDVVAVGDQLGNRLEEFGGHSYLLELLQSVPHAAHAEYYAGIVRSKAKRRRAMAQAERIREVANDPTASDDDVAAAIDAVGDAPRDDRQGLALMDSDEFDGADFEVDYLVENILVRGQPGVIAGPMKGGKTLCSVALAVHGATGTPLFGSERFAVPQSFRAAIFSMESGGGALRATARSVCHSVGSRLDDLAGMLFWNLDSIRVDDSRVLSLLRREIERRAIDLVIIDPLYLALNIDDDSSSNLYKMGAKLRGITKLISDTGAAVVLNHHATKKRENPRVPMQIHEMNGAGIGEWVRQWLLVSRRSDYDADQKGHHELWMAVGGSAGHGGAYALDLDEYSEAGYRREWHAEARPASVAIGDMRAAEEATRHAEREAKRIEADEQARKTYAPKVVRCLRLKANRDGASMSKIREFVGCTKKALTVTIDHLLGEGEVVECSFTGKNRQPYDGYRLAGEGHSEPLGSHSESTGVPSGENHTATHTRNTPL